MKKLLAVAVLSVLMSPAWAAVKTVTLAVPGMTCAACPITVKKALTKVDGVTKAGYTFGKSGMFSSGGGDDSGGGFSSASDRKWSDYMRAK